MSDEARRKWVLSDFKVEGEDVEGTYNWTDPSGCSWDGRESALASGLLGFCGCGQPDAALRYVLGGLDLIAEKINWDDPKSLPDHRARERAHFGSDGAAYFFWYWATNEDLAEHGGSVPGWLTQRGEQIRADIRSLLAPTPESAVLGPSNPTEPSGERE